MEGCEGGGLEELVGFELAETIGTVVEGEESEAEVCCISLANCVVKAVRRCVSF